MNSAKYKLTLVFVCALLLQACGAPHIRQSVSKDLDKYSDAYIASVEVSSLEKNVDSLKVNKIIQDYATQRLEKLIKDSGYKLIPAPEAPARGLLMFKMSFNIIYGSRAARYWGGFGSGKGSVNSLLEVVDSVTNETKYRASGASDLSVGAFGGSMEAVVKQNTDELLKNFEKAKAR